MKADYVHKDSRTLEEKPQVFTRWIDPTIKELKQENKQLKDNWNKLKECLKDVMNSSNGDDKDFVETILNIIQELEQGSDSNEIRT